MSKHAKYSPSQLPRIVRCPGSIKATENMIQPESVYANEGTMLHEVTEHALLSGQTNLSDTLKDKYKLTTEHIEAVQNCLDYTFTLKTKHEAEHFQKVETHVTLEGFVDALDCPQLLDVYGTLDYFLSFPSIRRLYIVDWKFGKGIEVFPDSEQLFAYALAALKNTNVLGRFDTITVCIGQPRLYAGEPFKELDISPMELYNWAKTKLCPALKEACSDTPSFHPSKKACQWCEARRTMTCKARHRAAQETAVKVFEAYKTIPNEVDLKELVALLKPARDLVKYIKDIESFLVNTLKSGKEVPGYKLVAGRSIRVWKDLDDGRPEKLLEWAEALGIDEFKLSTMKIMSPAQVEKKLGKKFCKVEGLETLIHKPKGKPTLAAETDKRKALVFKTAEDTFKQFAED